MQLKKLDGMLMKAFIPPFIVTFFIALFVLVMQTLWLYIDDIAGKGIGFFLLVELVSYMSVSMIPMALPVAVLISAVMVLGNLAERYELSSIKSAGVSLWRVMLPLMIVTGAIGIGSYFCSNNLIPVSNLKFKSRLHDIRKQKPTLSLEESVFNDDFQGFSIRLGNKLPDNKSIQDVILFDNTEASQGRLTMVAADSGDMYGSADGKFFVMHLFEGSQVMEPKPTIKDGKRNYPMMRATFDEWTKVFDLDEFELDRTDESLFKSHHTMLSNRQLLIAVDSIDKEIAQRIARNNEQNYKSFYFLQKEFEEQKKEERRRENERMKAERDSFALMKELETQSSAPPARVPEHLDKANLPKPQQNGEPVQPIKKLREINRPVIQPIKKEPQKNVVDSTKQSGPASQDSAQEKAFAYNLDTLTSIIGIFPKEKRGEYLFAAKKTAQTLKDRAESTVNSLQKTRESRVKHVFEYNTKFSMAVACLIFLFFGAPMGAIVRKGGFGWPLLISIVFFMLFIVISIFSKNIAERGVIHAVLASWMNCLVIFPMGLALTYWAMRDANLQQVIDFFKFKWVFEYLAIAIARAKKQ
ncbi:MAG: LptF/LptG family permease [Saprospiraceae bacterium]